jgi:glycosyltransferase involved in cell wall biosynthesis
MIHTPLTGRGGGERQILRLAIELQKLGHEVKIFVNAVDEEACYPNLLNKVKIIVIPHPLARFKPLYIRVAKKRVPWYDSILPRMINIGRSIPKGFDIINNHNFPTEWAVFFAKKRLGIPAVWMCNEPPFWFWQPEEMENRSKINWPLCGVFDKVAAKNIDEIVVLSRVAQELVKKIYDRWPKIVRSGVDIELFRDASREEMRKRHGLENDFVLLQVGNLSIRGRQTDSVEALYYLSKRYDNVKLILDGAGPRDALIKLSEKLGVRDKVLRLHSVSDEELAKMYAACDAFIFPSQITWGLAAIEAMAAGKPVIVSKNCGASEIIQSGENGIIVDHAKPKEMAEQAELLINNSKLRKKLGGNAYEYVKGNLSWEKYAKNMESVFQGAIVSFRRNL